MSESKKKVLILTGDAGLGHRSAAEAIQAAFESKFGGRCKTTIENPLNHPDIPDIIRQSQSNYDEIVKIIPELYKMGFKVSNSELPVTMMEGGFVVLLLNVLKEMIFKITPDIIISTYPIYSAPLQTLFKSEDLQIPLIATVTDFVTVHHVWFNKGVTNLTVPTEIVQKLALDAGLSEEQVINIGIPVNPQIKTLQETDVSDLRSELGWDKDLTSILVVGSPRIPSLMDILKTLDYSGYDIQFALVAGGNKSLLETFQNTTWHHPVKIYDFIDFMPKLMRSADLILSKSGGLIVTESLASGLPIMMVHFLPGQERGNVNYVVDHGAGELCKTPLKALETLCLWLENDQAQLKKVAKNSAQLGRPDAALKVADKAWHLLQ